MNVSSLQEFRQFIASAEAIMSQRGAVSLSQFVLPFDRQRFLDFAEQSERILVEGFRHRLPMIRQTVARLMRWITTHDLLWIAGLSLVEDSYTEMLAWMLQPGTHPATAVARQQAFVDAMKAEYRVVDSCVPATQFRTQDGVPDLVLSYQDACFVVEVKTNSVEHPTPSGGFQTNSYGPAVRCEANIKAETPVYTGYLTVDRTAARNEKSFCFAFVDIIFAMARSLANTELDPHTHAAFSQVFTHWLHHAAPERCDAVTLLHRLVAALAPEPPKAAVVLAAIQELMQFSTIFRLEAHDARLSTL